jgi:hypothetical protein
MRPFVIAVVFTFAAAVVAQDWPTLFQEDFENGAERWQPTDSKAWKVVKHGTGHAFHQFEQSKYKTVVRSPFNFALVKDVLVSDFVFEAKALSTFKDYPHRDMIVVFGYQDPSHFYYVHMGKATDDHANQIFIVNGKDRVKISTSTTQGTPWDDKWHNVKIVRHVKEGSIKIFWDDMKTPIMTATDTTFAWGQMGVGTFDDTGMWDDVKISGVVHKK